MIDRTITYRLIGAGIMVLSAAIVLPLILDGERPAELDVQVRVTPTPDFEPINIVPAQPIDQFHETVQQEAQASTDDIRLIPVPKPAVDRPLVQNATPPQSTESSAPAGERWTLQIATFKSQDNAIRLVDKLKEANYSAYSITTNSLYKVYVGPEFKREVSNKMREEIKTTFNLTGIVVKYSVN